MDIERMTQPSNTYSGKIIKGLTLRRQAEAELYEA